MTESDFLERWNSERPMYEAWGEHVCETILSRLAPEISPSSVDVFIKLPPKPRVKDNDSLVDKAFYRGKPYSDPYADITDKVGVRFVVLLRSDISAVEKVIINCGEWQASKDKDFEAEQDAEPLQFGYQSVHYVVRASIDAKFYDQDIKKGTPCEVQVRTLLQHAHSELTHDTIYKPKDVAAPKTRRTVAKAMALIEATSDFFDQVILDLRTSTQESRTISDELAKLYATYVGQEPKRSGVEGIVLNAYSAQLGDDAAGRAKAFLESKPYIATKIVERRPTHHLFKQPCVLLVYLLVGETPSLTKANWPLTPDEISPIFTDLGLTFAAY